jgi:hypothetical protein
VRLHQQDVPRLAVGLKLDDELRVRHRPDRVIVGERSATARLERPDADLPQVLAPSLDPRAGVSGEERPASDRVGDERRTYRALEIAGTERRLGLVDGGVGRFDVDPRVDRQPELVAPERVLDRRPRPDVVERRAELADKGAKRRLPGRRRCAVPQDLGELVDRNRAAALPRQDDEREPALSPGEALLWHERVPALHGHVAGEVHPQCHGSSNDRPIDPP